MTAAWSASPRPLTSSTTAPGAWLWPYLVHDWFSSRGCYSGRAAAAPAGTVAWPPSAPVSTVEHCVCIGPPPLQPPSASFIKITSVHPCLLRMGEMGWGWWVGGAEPTMSCLVVPIEDVNERRTSLEIVYAAWHVWQCDVCMLFDTSDGPR